MNAVSTVPSSGNQTMTRRMDYLDPFQAFRREMSRVFDDVFRGFGMPGLAALQPARMPPPMLMPQADVSETEQEIRITAEMPGIDEKNVEVTFTDDILTIRGEKQDERDEKQRDYHVMERSSGSFLRSLRLPFSVDPKQVHAAMKDGVLTITITKPKDVQDKTRKIEVKREEGSAGQQSQKAA